MLTYDMHNRGELGLYEYLYRCIRADIISGAIAADDRLPSKRALAQHLGVSVVTVEGAYRQLAAEGYIRSVPCRGYYANALVAMPHTNAPSAAAAQCETDRDMDLSQFAQQATPDSLLASADDAAGFSTSQHTFDLSSALLPEGIFPYTTWARCVRDVLSQEPENELLTSHDSFGSQKLRSAICDYLHNWRGMDVAPAQVVVGAGAQVLYNLIVQLVGRNRLVALEDPGYPRLAQIYSVNDAETVAISLDEQGIDVKQLAASGASVAHIMPSHQYPTGIVTSIARRYELLGWAAADASRIIIEDDYDCELRLAGRPVPSLQSIDTCGQVVYINTFAKTLGAAFRIGYVVLPARMAEEFRKKLGFYSSTVSAVDQLALARFIREGDYERHVNRLRTHCRGVRDALVAQLKASSVGDKLVFEQLDSGIHFMLGVQDARAEQELVDLASQHGVRILPISSFARAANGSLHLLNASCKWFFVTYVSLQSQETPALVSAIEQAWSE